MVFFVDIDIVEYLEKCRVFDFCYFVCKVVIMLIIMYLNVLSFEILNRMICKYNYVVDWFLKV